MPRNVLITGFVVKGCRKGSVIKDLLIVFEKDLSLVPGCVDQRCDEKWNIFIDYDSPRGPCPSSGCLLCFLHKMQRKDSKQAIPPPIKS